jgi:hypothetical protein
VALLQATIDEYTGALSSNLEHLAENMLKPGVCELVRPKVLIARKLCEHAERLVKLTSCDIRSLPFSFSTWFHAWLDLLQIGESDVEEFITAAVGGTVPLTAAQRAAVAQATLLAISEARQRPFSHLFQSVPAQTAARGIERVREILGVYQRRECFAIEALPVSDDPAAVTICARRALGRSILTVPGFQGAFSAFHTALRDKTLPAGIPLPPMQPVAALPDHNDYDDYGVAPLDPTPEYTQSLAAFWAAVAANQSYAALGMAALRALAIPVSQTVVERAFSQLKNLATPNRLHAGRRYVLNLAMLNSNEPYSTTKCRRTRRFSCSAYRNWSRLCGCSASAVQSRAWVLIPLLASFFSQDFFFLKNVFNFILWR